MAFNKKVAGLKLQVEAAKEAIKSGDYGGQDPESVKTRLVLAELTLNFVRLEERVTTLEGK